jgi:hypothetical protein
MGAAGGNRTRQFPNAGNNQLEHDNELPFLLLISDMNIRLVVVNSALIGLDIEDDRTNPGPHYQFRDKLSQTRQGHLRYTCFTSYSLVRCTHTTNRNKARDYLVA